MNLRNAVLVVLCCLSAVANAAEWEQSFWDAHQQLPSPMALNQVDELQRNKWLDDKYKRYFFAGFYSQYFLKYKADWRAWYEKNIDVLTSEKQKTLLYQSLRLMDRPDVDEFLQAQQYKSESSALKEYISAPRENLLKGDVADTAIPMALLGAFAGTREPQYIQRLLELSAVEDETQKSKRLARTLRTMLIRYCVQEDDIETILANTKLPQETRAERQRFNMVAKCRQDKAQR